jgi:hypothetical protein
MSSRLCKYTEGASFPFQVESLEDGVDDSVHGLHVDEANHGRGTTADFDETAFDDVGGAHPLSRTRRCGGWLLRREFDVARFAGSMWEMWT